MIVFVSPAKKLDEAPIAPPVPTTQGALMDDAQVLLDTAQRLSRGDLKSLMGISDKLADLNYLRFQNMDFPFTNDNAKPAGFMFSGDTYAGLDIGTLSAEDLTYAQNHFRILSGFYGILRPMDLIQPYRLEMGIKLQNPHGEDLYDYWGDSVRDVLVADAKNTDNPVLVNCASNEYSHVLSLKTLPIPVITPVFKERKGGVSGVAKIVSFSAKRARGMMARHIIQNRITTVDGLRDFDSAGYVYQPEQSDDNILTFIRDTD